MAKNVQCPETLIRLLRSGVAAHDLHEFEQFGSAFDEYEGYEKAEQGEFEKWNQYCRYFVDCWIDASIHEWQYHAPIAECDWIPLAEELIAAIRESRPFRPLTLRGKVLENYRTIDDV